MNLARALLSLPDVIEFTPEIDLRSEKKKSGAGRPKGHWKPKPDGMVEACAIVYIIGQFTQPVSYAALARWANATYGTKCQPETIWRAIRRYGVKRKQQPFSLPDNILLECTQLALIQYAHGEKQPWMRVVDQLWINHRIERTNHSIACTVKAWMGAYRRQR